MPQFRKKTLINAEQFTGENAEYLDVEMYDNDGHDEPHWAIYDFFHKTFIRLEVGDWIAIGIKGEKYPIKNEVFKETYEEVQV